MKHRAVAKHRLAVASLVDHPSDYGPGFARRRGRVVRVAAIAAGDGLDMVDVPDPDREDARHEVRVARRVDPLRNILRIYDRDTNDANLFAAAEKLRADTKAANVSLAPLDLDGVPGSSRGDPMTERRLWAAQRVRQAWLAIRGRDNDAMAADVVRLIVLGWATLTRVEDRYGFATRRREGSMGLGGRQVRNALYEGLERLARHYGID